MIRYLAVALFALTAVSVSAQELSLPFGSPPYGKNGNLAIAVELTPTLDALKSGALGMSLSAEAAPNHTSKYSVKAEVSYYHMDSSDLFGSDSFVSGLFSGGVTVTTNIIDVMGILRIYPTAQSINTFFVGLGMGANILMSSVSGSDADLFTNFSSNNVVNPEIQFEAGYKMRLFQNFFIEPSVNYKLLLPPPGISISASIPIYTFLTTNDSGLLTGIETSVSAGLEF